MSWGAGPLTAASATASAKSVEEGSRAFSAAVMGSAVALALRNLRRLSMDTPWFSLRKV